VHGAKPKYYHSLIGGNFRLDTIQAAALLVKLPHLEAWHAARRRNAEFYHANFTHQSVHMPEFRFGSQHHVFNQYVIAIPQKRDELIAFLKKNEIGSEVYYPVAFHEQECFKSLGHSRGDFPNSEFAARHTIALPIYPEITTEMQEFVVKKVEEFCDIEKLSPAPTEWDTSVLQQTP
jgi:dTDP-4-amino-4,6-dideoxygalactose transaminase